MSKRKPKKPQFLSVKVLPNPGKNYTITPEYLRQAGLYSPVIDFPPPPPIVAARGEHGDGTRGEITHAEPSNPAPRSADAGITKQSSSESQRIARLPPETQQRLQTGELIHWVIRTATGFRERAIDPDDAKCILMAAASQDLAVIRRDSPDLARFFKSLSDAAASIFPASGGAQS